MTRQSRLERLFTLSALFLVVFLVTPVGQAFASSVDISVRERAGSSWARSYGGPGSESTVFSVEQTSGGGYVAAGSMGGNFWVLRLNPSGNVIWQKTYGGGAILSAQQTSDRGFVIASGGRVVKLDFSGNIVWQKFYHGGNIESIRETTDHEYVAAGGGSNGVFGPGEIAGGWILRLDSAGNVVWQKVYSGNQTGHWKGVFRVVDQTSDGGFIVTGTANLIVGLCDYGPCRFGPLRAWILKVDGSGDVMWQKVLEGGSGNGVGDSVQQASDGGYIVSGMVHLPGNIGGFPINLEGAWLVRLDSGGGIVWQNAYGVAGISEFSSVQQTSDGGYVAAGETSALGAERAFVVRVNATGSVLWERALGIGGGDEANAVRQTSDGGYVVAAHTFSFGPGLDNAWVVKLNSRGFCCRQIQSSISPTVNVTSATIAPTNVVPVNTDVPVILTSAVAVDTQATVLTQCQPRAGGDFQDEQSGPAA